MVDSHEENSFDHSQKNRTWIQTGSKLLICIIASSLAFVFVLVVVIPVLTVIKEVSEFGNQSYMSETILEGDEAEAYIANINWSSAAEFKRKCDLISDSYVWESGNFGGSYYFHIYTCENIDDCWEVLHPIVRSTRDDFIEWKKPTYVETLNGPRSYWSNGSLSEWKLGEIKKGLYRETIRLNQDSLGVHSDAKDHVNSLYYYAVDIERCTVYIHGETGGAQLTRLK